MLALLFNIGTERFGLDAEDVVEVVPLVALQPPAQPSDFIVGEFSYRGVMIPVLDLGRMTGQSPCAALLSTRIILVRRGSDRYPDRIVGLQAEKVTETVRISATQLNVPEQQFDEAAYRTPLKLEGFGSVQLLHLDRLLPTSLLDALIG